MPHFALELDDRAVAIATEGRVLSSAPSAVFDGTSGTTVGANAWRELRIRPRAISTRHLSAVLALTNAPGAAIPPDGTMPDGAQENCLKFLLSADPKLEADKGKIKLADTWTNEFAAKAKKAS